MKNRFNNIAEIGRDPEGGWTRLAYSPEDLEARSLVTEFMREAGLSVRIDGAGNIIGRRDGSSAEAAVVGTGSHLDTVVNGGAFDGALGVVAGIECLQAMAEDDFRNFHPIEVIVFNDEEGARFGTGVFGSSAMSGEDVTEFLQLTDKEGISRAEAMEGAGLDPERVGDAALGDDYFKICLEMHIEQGKVLEEKGVDVGIVEGISGLLWKKVEIMGAADHAGATPMRMRRDALTAAAAIIQRIEALASEGADPLMATVGKVEVRPGMVNTIPGKAVFTLDIRDIDKRRRDRFFEQIEKEIKILCHRRDLDYQIENLFDLDPVLFPQKLVQLLMEICEGKGIGYTKIISGAGHDSLKIARIAPTIMIFLPTKNGLSHCPEEETSWEAVAKGTEVLLETMVHQSKTL